MCLNNFDPNLPSWEQLPQSWPLRAIKSEVEDIRVTAEAKSDSKCTEHFVSPVLSNRFVAFHFCFNYHVEEETVTPEALTEIGGRAQGRSTVSTAFLLLC